MVPENKIIKLRAIRNLKICTFGEIVSLMVTGYSYD